MGLWRHRHRLVRSRRKAAGHEHLGVDGTLIYTDLIRDPGPTLEWLTDRDQGRSRQYATRPPARADAARTKGHSPGYDSVSDRNSPGYRRGERHHRDGTVLATTAVQRRGAHTPSAADVAGTVPRIPGTNLVSGA